MNTTADMNPQTASIREFEGDVQVIRAGYFYPAEAGMLLAAGDRITTSAGAAVTIDFSGTNQDLVVRDGSAATLFLQVTEENLPAQWMVADLYGKDVFFAEEGSPDTQVQEPTSLYGLFGGGEESTDIPVAETAAAIGATALVLGGNDDTTSADTDASTTQSDNTNNGTSGDNNSSAPPASEPEPASSPLDALLTPLQTEQTDGVTESLGRTGDILGISSNSGSLNDQNPIPNDLA